jgi:FkbM family methyltransferase
MRIKLKSNTVNFEVRTTNDFYGEDFWTRFSNKTYEPDTIQFIENNCNDLTDFFDIGAANGSMSLLAASLGASVYAYEPNPLIYEVAKLNIQLNTLRGKIKLVNKAISIIEGKLEFEPKADPTILSTIVFTGMTQSHKPEIEVLSLESELMNYHAYDYRRIIIKMDIEGAEWKILNSISTLKVLNQHNAVMLLAVHPGFYRPYKKILKGLDMARHMFWQAKNIRDSVKLFDKLKTFSSIQRTNLNFVESKWKFAGLIFFGYHEFIINFSK